MNKQIKIYCENTQKEKSYPFGTRLHDIIIDQKIDLKFPILGAMVNNQLKELDYLIYKPKTVRFINYLHPDGRRMYLRSLSLVLFKATVDLFPNAKLKIEHAISNGLYCEIKTEDKSIHITDIVEQIKKRMKEIIDEDITFEREELKTETALHIFEEFGLNDKCTLMQTRKQFYSSVYRLKDAVNYFYGYLAPSTGYLKTFNLIKHYDGMLLVLPQKTNPEKTAKIIKQDKLFDIFQEYKDWVRIIGTPNVGQLNLAAQNGDISNIIKVSEALQEKKIAHIADIIHRKKKELKVILISGPSSSGKTTFAKRLSVQLSVLGFKPLTLSMDNYFLDREFTPKDEQGEYDFESPYALDIDFFNQNMLDLFKGKEIKRPRFSFADGKRYFDDSTLKMNDDNILLVEGIHGLNPMISKMIPNHQKFKIYVSALTPLNIDSNNRIPTTDNRLIRRMVRDSLYRSYSALETLQRWPSVRKGEENHIFPFQEEADVMFNTALVYELGVLKRWAEPILKEVPPIVAEYSEAKRLLKFLSYILPIPEHEIPPNSILREFVEGSSFKY